MPSRDHWQNRLLSKSPSERGVFQPRSLRKHVAFWMGSLMILARDSLPTGWGFYLNPHDSTYHVWIDPEDSDAAAKIQNELGDLASIEFANGSRLDRDNDGQPHWGGAAIHPGNLDFNNCTSAFVVFLPNGNRGAVTAGHCFKDTGNHDLNGRNVKSGNQDYGGETAGGSDYPNYDMVRIGNGGNTWDNKIHVDPCCPSVRTVVATGNPDVGDPICVSGMTSLAMCGLEVKATDTTFCDNVGCSLHQIRATRSGDVVVRRGDSGGPMYNRFGDTDAAARGLIIAGSNCNNQGGCTSVFAHRISSVTGHLDVTVDTG